MTKSRITFSGFLKMAVIGISLFVLQTVMYYLASQIANGTINFSTELDRKIPFLPGFVYIYFSLYVMLIVYFGFFLQYFDKRELWTKVVPSIIVMLVVAFIAFIAFPSHYPRPPITPYKNSLTYKLMRFLYNADPANNTTPSLHVTSSFLLAIIAYEKSRKIGIFFTAWALLIALSTLFVKQHYVTDAIAGIILATLIYFVVYQRLYWVVKWRYNYEKKKRSPSSVLDVDKNEL